MSLDVATVSPLGIEVPRKGTAEPVRRVVLLPPSCTVNDDSSIQVPTAWQFDDKWQHRNDTRTVLEHNVAVQLAQSRMIESVKGRH